MKIVEYCVFVGVNLLDLYVSENMFVPEDEGENSDEVSNGVHDLEIRNGANQDDYLPPLLRLERYAMNGNMYNRQMVGRVALETLRAVADTPEDIRAAMDIINRAAFDTDMNVRAELMEQLPHIAMICHEERDRLYFVVQDYLLPLVIRFLGDSDNLVRKTTQAALLVLMEQGLVEMRDVELQVCPVILTLTEVDNLVELHTAAVALMSKMAPLLGAEATERLFMRRFAALCADPVFYVRKVCANTFGDFCTVVGTAATEEFLLPYFVELCSDGIWGVRKACAEVFTTVALHCTLQTRKGTLAPVFNNLLLDQSRWVRMSAFQALGQFIATFVNLSSSNLSHNEHGEIVIHHNEDPRFNTVSSGAHSDITRSRSAEEANSLLSSHTFNFSKGTLPVVREGNHGGLSNMSCYICCMQSARISTIGNVNSVPLLSASCCESSVGVDKTDLEVSNELCVNSVHTCNLSSVNDCEDSIRSNLNTNVENEITCQNFNTFQYWRVPIPELELSNTTNEDNTLIVISRKKTNDVFRSTCPRLQSDINTSLNQELDYLASRLEQGILMESEKAESSVVCASSCLRHKEKHCLENIQTATINFPQTTGQVYAEGNLVIGSKPFGPQDHEDSGASHNEHNVSREDHIIHALSDISPQDPSSSLEPSAPGEDPSTSYMESSTVHMELSTLHTGSRSVYMEPRTLHMGPSTLHEEPRTLHEEPRTLHEEPSILLEEPSILHEEPSILHEEPSILHEEPSTLHESSTLHEPRTLHEEPSTLHKEPSPIHEERSTLHDQPSTLYEESILWKEHHISPEDSSTLREHPSASQENSSIAYEVTSITEEGSSIAHDEFSSVHESSAMGESANISHGDPSMLHGELSVLSIMKNKSHNEPSTLHNEIPVPCEPNSYSRDTSCLSFCEETPCLSHQEQVLSPLAPTQNLSLLHQKQKSSLSFSEQTHGSALYQEQRPTVYQDQKVSTIHQDQRLSVAYQMQRPTSYQEQRHTSYQQQRPMSYQEQRPLTLYHEQRPLASYQEQKHCSFYHEEEASTLYHEEDHNTSYAVVNHLIQSDVPSNRPLQDIVPHYLVEHFVSMTYPSQAQNTDNEITHHCAFSIPAVALTLGRRNWHLIKPAYEALASDVQWKVRRTVAASIHELAVILGEELAGSDLVPVFHGFIKDLDEVRIGALKHLADFLRLLRPAERNFLLHRLSDFNLTDNECNWRFRNELAEQLHHSLVLFTPGDTHEHITPLSISLLMDKVSAVRKKALCLVTQLVHHVSSEVNLVRSLLAELAEQFAHNKHWSRRQTFALLCSQLMSQHVLKDEHFACVVFPHLLDLSWDPVPNVRLSVAQTVACDIAVQSYFSSSESPHNEVLIQCLRRLQDDDDKDVRYFASLYSIPSSTTSSEFSSGDQ